MIYFPVPWIHRINPVSWFPPPVAPFWSAFFPTHPSKLSPRVGRDPFGLITTNREPLAYNTQPSARRQMRLPAPGWENGKTERWGEGARGRRSQMSSCD